MIEEKSLVDQENRTIDIIDVMTFFTADLKGIEAIDTGEIIRYACTWKKGGGLQDLQKLIQTATHLFNYELGQKAKEKATNNEY